MKKRKILIVCFLALLIIFPFVFSGCSSKSNMIYCDDFTTTYKVNLMLNVKNRTRFAPTDGKQAFVTRAICKRFATTLTTETICSVSS